MTAIKTMPDGLRHLRQAAAVLSFLDEDAPSKDVLAKAFREVWLASADWGRWPPELREAGERLVAICFRDGAIRSTVQQMSEDEMKEAAALIRSLAVEADRLNEKG